MLPLLLVGAVSICLSCQLLLFVYLAQCCLHCTAHKPGDTRISWDCIKAILSRKKEKQIYLKESELSWANSLNNMAKYFKISPFSFYSPHSVEVPTTSKISNLFCISCPKGLDVHVILIDRRQVQQREGDGEV